MHGPRALRATPSLTAVLGLALVAALVGACNLLNGSGDLEVGPGLGEGTLADGGRPDGSTGGGDGGSTGTDGGGTTTDSGGVFTPDAGVDPKLTTCGMNLICLPDVSGWTPAVFAPGGGPNGGACPPAYPQQNVLRQSGGGGCDCICSAGGGSCAGSVDSKSGPLCAGTPTDLGVTSGQCTPITLDLPLPVAFIAHPSGTTPTSCGATVMPRLNKSRPATYCTGATPVMSATMCDQGEVCVSKASLLGGAFTCIVHDGDIACPSHLPFRTLLGTTVTDGRSCSNTCACQQQPCAGTIEAFSDTACATAVRSVNTDGTCTTAGAAMSGASYRYTASLGCGVSTPAMVLGTETYADERTLCCAIGF